MNRQVACMLLLCCIGLAVDTFAQQTDFVARERLQVRASAPKWWHLRLPRETGHVVTTGQQVRVLDRVSHNTLLGQQVWFYIEVPPSDPNEQEPATTGWVLGKNDGHTLLQPAPVSR